MRRARPLPLLTLLALALPALAAPLAAQQARPIPGLPGAGPPALRREIEELNRGMEAAFNRGDMRAVARFYADDAIVAGPGGAVVKGRAAVDRYWEGIRNPRSWKLDVIEVGGSADDAYQVGRSTLVSGPAGSERTSVVDFVVIWRRGADGKLRIYMDFYN
jgi:uncharacterized protein (TIGR02246 family)